MSSIFFVLLFFTAAICKLQLPTGDRESLKEGLGRFKVDFSAVEISTPIDMNDSLVIPAGLNGLQLYIQKCGDEYCYFTRLDRNDGGVDRQHMFFACAFFLDYAIYPDFKVKRYRYQPVAAATFARGDWSKYTPTPGHKDFFMCYLRQYRQYFNEQKDDGGCHIQRSSKGEWLFRKGTSGPVVCQVECVTSEFIDPQYTTYQGNSFVSSNSYVYNEDSDDTFTLSQLSGGSDEWDICVLANITEKHYYPKNWLTMCVVGIDGTGGDWAVGTGTDVVLTECSYLCAQFVFPTPSPTLEPSAAPIGTPTPSPSREVTLPPTPRATTAKATTTQPRGGQPRAAPIVLYAPTEDSDTVPLIVGGIVLALAIVAGIIALFLWKKNMALRKRSSRKRGGSARSRAGTSGLHSFRRQMSRAQMSRGQSQVYSGPTQDAYTLAPAYNTAASESSQLYTAAAANTGTTYTPANAKGGEGYSTLAPTAAHATPSKTGDYGYGAYVGFADQTYNNVYESALKNTYGNAQYTRGYY